MNDSIKTYRIIFHIDMNCFFASCEIANDPSLKNKPIVIAHNDTFKKSIILTATYEARKFGIYTTMLVRDAIKLCPEVIVIEPNYQLYQYYSKQFFDYLYTITKKIEVMSIDEGYLDVTEVCENINALELANKIQKTLLEDYMLPCSIGIAPNKFLAKMASDMKKPLGITILRKRDVPEKLWPLEIEAMLGVGKKTSPKLREAGINTIGDILKTPKELLIKITGPNMSEYLIQRAQGNDSSLVMYENVDDVSSISNSSTLNFDENDVKVLKDTLKVLVNSVSYRLEKDELAANTIGIQIKYSDFRLTSRSKGLDSPIYSSFDIWNVVDSLFDDFYEENAFVRLVGVFATRLVEQKQEIKQYSIFDDMSKIDKENDIRMLLKKINTTIGKDTISIGVEVPKEKKKSIERKPLFQSNSIES